METDPFVLLMHLLISWGVNPTYVALYLPLIIFALNLIGRWIPDDAVGFWGIVRKICKVGGLYLSNRITGTTSVAKVAGVLTGVLDHDDAPNTTRKLQSTLPDLVPLDLNESSKAPEPLFRPRDEQGRFTKADGQANSPSFAVAVAIILSMMVVILALPGCTTLGAVGVKAAGQEICARRLTLELAARQTILDHHSFAEVTAAQAMLMALSQCPAPKPVSE